MSDNQIILASTKKRQLKHIAQAAVFTDGLSVVHSETPNHFLEILTTQNVLMVIAEKQENGTTLEEIGTILMSSGQTTGIPLLIISKDPLPDFFLTKSQPLKTDQILPPLSPVLLSGKIRLLFELSAHRLALKKSMDELNAAHTQCFDLQEQVFEKRENTNKISETLHRYTSQFHSGLGALQSRIKQLAWTAPEHKNLTTGFNTIQTSVDKLKQDLFHFNHQMEAFKQNEDNDEDVSPEKILIISPSGESLHILSRFIEEAFCITPEQAKNLTEVEEKLTQFLFDVIFLEDGSDKKKSSQLISRLRQLRTRTPLLIGVSKHSTLSGDWTDIKDVAGFFSKETLSAERLKTIVAYVLKKQDRYQKMKTASRKVSSFLKIDRRTSLTGREAFIDRLTSEINRAQRYSLNLSILVLSLSGMPPEKSSGDELAAGLNNSFSETIFDISMLIRSGDFLCRLENDLMGIILPHTEKKGAIILEHRIHSRLSERIRKSTAMAIDRTMETDAFCLLDKAIDRLNNTDQYIGKG